MKKNYNRPTLFALLLAFSLALTNLIFPHLHAAHSASEPAEIRGVWLTNIDSDVLFEEEKLARAIDTLSQLNFNTLYPTIWNWGYTLYPSAVAGRVTGKTLDPAEGLQGRDLLQEILQQGHKGGMGVIPWFEFGFMAPADSQLAARHPQWLTQRRDGSKIWWEGKVHQRVWLNPLHPEVQQFITDLVLEMLDRYPVDGIQFDDHFGYPADFGYDSLTVRLYQQEHGGKSPPPNSQDPDWIQWRADKITEYMAQLQQAIKAKNPQAIVSLSPNPQQFSLEAFLLDWSRWQTLGLIDELVLQLYRNNLGDFLRELAQPEVQQAKKQIPVGIGILTGVKGKPVPMTRIQKQVQATRDRQFAGVSFFFYESLWQMAQEPAPYRQRAFKSLFATPKERRTS